MSDILTNLYINIDKFSYTDPVLRLDYNDIELLTSKRKQAVIIPSLFFISTFMFSRSRPKLWAYTKNYFLGNRTRIQEEAIPIIKKEISEVTADKIAKPSAVSAHSTIVNPKYEEVYYKNLEIKITGSRNLKLKKGETKQSDDSYNLPRKEPSIAKEYLSFTSNYMPKGDQLSMMKKFTKKLGNSDSFKNNAEERLLNTKLIYIPFFLVLISYIYDLAFTYFGLYFKYQPLVNEYYDQKVDKKLI